MSSVIERFNQHEEISRLFKEYGYDMEESRRCALERTMPIREPILDVGTGPGRMACVLAQAGFKERFLSGILKI